jgi:glucose/arabinose dehydrogenase
LKRYGLSTTFPFALFPLLTLSIFTFSLVGPNLIQEISAAYIKAKPVSGGPTLIDPKLRVQVVFKNNGQIDIPTTSMTFLGPDDILVLEKNQGTVLRIIDGKLQKSPLLKVDVGDEVEWGMLGIAVAKSDSKTYAFLFYTESDHGTILGNRLYRYELINDKLVNPILLLDLPALSPHDGQENNHDGGKVAIGPDQNVYVGIGDVGGRTGEAQNNVHGSAMDGTSGILRITQNGQPVGKGILGNSVPLNIYYAYGIRNSFGFDFDPVTGNMWDTENGSEDKDEINLVFPGFNSGWTSVMGMAPKKFDTNENLVNFGGKGKYADPKFVWKQTIGPTALKFLNSDKLGQEYKDTMFTGDVNNGYLYNFKLDRDRTGLSLEGPLADRVANTPSEEQKIIFGQGFGVITDIKVSPDGYLYILGYDGTIYKIVPNSTT